jgi:hypothetical protein
MTGQIIFFEKNKIDISSTVATLSVVDTGAIDNGADFLRYLGDRKNFTGWMTTGSADANNTTIEINTADPEFIDSIILIKHNLKSYSFQYFDGVDWQDFSTPINPTNDTDETSYFEFDEVLASRFRIIISGTKIADDDKKITQLIITKSLGRLVGWPKIRRPFISTSRVVNRMLSGKAQITEGAEVFSCTLAVESWKIQEDIDLMTKIFRLRKGVLIWLNGGVFDQFTLSIRGYRPEDLFLVRPTSEWNAELFANYKTGIKVSVDFAEVVE